MNKLEEEVARLREIGGLVDVVAEWTFGELCPPAPGARYIGIVDGDKVEVIDENCRACPRFVLTIDGQLVRLPEVK